MPESSSWRKNLPMWITFSRVAMIPFLVALMLGKTQAYEWASALLFAIASITDYYDGYFARKFNAISNMGKFMDPVADKILVSSVFVMLLYLNKIDPYMVILILARDTYIGGLRAIAAADQFVIDAKAAGKWKTAMQMGAIPFLIIGDIGNIPLSKWSYIILWLSVVLSLTSGWEYYRAYKTARKKH
jgi:CDP-diacylglycerol--glycerol-3-phosphate 3-phosphatidyltransferase